MTRLAHPSRLVPGLLLCGAVTLAAMLAEQLELHLLGSRALESLVLAIIIGTALRSSIVIPEMFQPGITCGAKFLLEVAIVLLGASISLSALADAGGALVGGIAVVVTLSLLFSFGIGRAVGLPVKLATLVACGNSICGNSAIAAAAPVIDADPGDVTSAIAFTAILGVAAVLILPLMQAAAGYSAGQYGVFAGLTVYAVPQVLAATAPAGLISVQTGMLVKLTRVLMLGPVLFVLGIVRGSHGSKLSLRAMLPWFIIGFAAMMALRSLGLIPAAALGPIGAASNVLTIVAMAALGLSVDIRHAARSGGRVMLAASLSLLLLCGLSIVAIGILSLS
ncbi:MAG: YeiH family protein [Allorhizobium sp.]